MDNYEKNEYIHHDRTGGSATIFINSKHNFIQRSDLIISVTDYNSVFIEIPNREIIIGLIYKPGYVIYDHFITLLEKTLLLSQKEEKQVLF